MFGGFTRSGDAPMLSEFTRRSRTARGIIDVGANAGLYTYHAAAVGSSDTQIIAVEAIGELADLINQNLALNGRANARALHAAASDMEGQRAFFVAESDQVSSLEPTHIKSYRGARGALRQVHATTIDRIVEDEAMAHVDLMKIDVEGHELKTLAGAQQTLRDHRPTLILEAKRETAEPVRAMLAELGYRMRRFDSDGCVEPGRELVPGDAALADFLCEQGDA